MTPLRLYLLFYAAMALIIILERLAQNTSSPVRAAYFKGFFASGMAALMWQVSDPPSHLFADFDLAYYPAGHAIIEDISQLYIPSLDNNPVFGFVNVPVVGVLFAPMALLPISWAHWVYSALSLVCIVATISLLCALIKASTSTRYIVILLFVLNGPLFYSVRLGNLTHLALLSLVAGIFCLNNGWKMSAGALFAMTAVIKLPLLLIGLYLVMIRQWACCAGFSVMLVSLAAVSIGYAGWDSHLAWYREVIQPFAYKGLGDFNVQSIDAFLLRLRDGVPLYTAWVAKDNGGNVRIIRLSVTALLIGASAFVMLRNSVERTVQIVRLELCIVVCLALTISPISWTHYYAFLLVPLSLYVGKDLPIPFQATCMIGMFFSFLLVTPPVNGVQRFLPQLMVSHYLAGALMLWTVLAYARMRVGHFSLRA